MVSELRSLGAGAPVSVCDPARPPCSARSRWTGSCPSSLLPQSGVGQALSGAVPPRRRLQSGMHPVRAVRAVRRGRVAHAACRWGARLVPLASGACTSGDDGGVAASTSPRYAVTPGAAATPGAAGEQGRGEPSRPRSRERLVDADRPGTRAGAEGATAHAGRGGPRHGHAQGTGKTSATSGASRWPRTAPTRSRSRARRVGRRPARATRSTTRRPALGSRGAALLAALPVRWPRAAHRPPRPAGGQGADRRPRAARGRRRGIRRQSAPSSRLAAQTHRHPPPPSSGRAFPRTFRSSGRETSAVTRQVGRRGHSSGGVAAVSRSWALTGRR